MQLLSEVFDSDGQLDWFAGWLWTVRFIERVNLRLDEFTGWVDPGRTPAVARDWLQVKEREATTSGIHSPLGGGSDPHSI